MNSKKKISTSIFYHEKNLVGVHAVGVLITGAFFRDVYTRDKSAANKSHVSI